MWASKLQTLQRLKHMQLMWKAACSWLSTIIQVAEYKCFKMPFAIHHPTILSYVSQLSESSVGSGLSKRPVFKNCGHLTGFRSFYVQNDAFFGHLTLRFVGSMTSVVIKFCQNLQETSRTFLFELQRGQLGIQRLRMMVIFVHHAMHAEYKWCWYMVESHEPAQSLLNGSGEILTRDADKACLRFTLCRWYHFWYQVKKQLLDLSRHVAEWSVLIWWWKQMHSEGEAGRELSFDNWWRTE